MKSRRIADVVVRLGLTQSRPLGGELLIPFVLELIWRHLRRDLHWLAQSASRIRELVTGRQERPNSSPGFE
jgi:hypothetical protein